MLHCRRNLEEIQKLGSYSELDAFDGSDDDDDDDDDDNDEC